jgi:hypothetical protein
MGPPESPTNPPQNQGTTPWKQRRHPTRQPRTRRCLLKGCESCYRPQQARQRYCSGRCREAARAWSRWKAQEKYRATPTGKEKRKAQSQRYRERVRARQQQDVQGAEAAARVITTNFFRGLLRPAWLLREVRAQPEITAPAVLLAGVPTRVGARPGAGTALEGEVGRVSGAGSGGPPPRRVEGSGGASEFGAEIVPTY